MSAAKIKKGDKVVVLSGKDKGRHGEVTKVMPKDGKVLVSGINVARPPRQADPGASAGRHRPRRGADAHFEGRDRGSRRRASRRGSASRSAMERRSGSRSGPGS